MLIILELIVRKTKVIPLFERENSEECKYVKRALTAKNGLNDL